MCSHNWVLSKGVWAEVIGTTSSVDSCISPTQDSYSFTLHQLNGVKYKALGEGGSIWLKAFGLWLCRTKGPLAFTGLWCRQEGNFHCFRTHWNFVTSFSSLNLLENNYTYSYSFATCHDVSLAGHNFNHLFLWVLSLLVPGSLHLTNLLSLAKEPISSCLLKFTYWWIMQERIWKVIT